MTATQAYFRNHPDPHAGQAWVELRNCVAEVQARNLAEVLPALTEVCERVDTEGLYAGGFVSYEAAAAFDPNLPTHSAGDWPLLWFGLFRRRVPSAGPRSLPGAGQQPPLWRGPVRAGAYAETVRTLLGHIRAGDVYQVNYTTRLQAAGLDAAHILPLALQQAPYSAYLQNSLFAVASASPELFFSLRGESIFSKPMKGTAARGCSPAEDQARRAVLQNSAKDRAENLMILDMVRNDLSRIADTGSVRVPQRFTLEKYPSVWQMTSTVAARTSAGLPDIFRALFPAASITGAPKRAAMQCIKRMEAQPRQLYTGAIGTISPNRQALFNVAIRSAWINQHTGRASYGAGGGIVADSKPAAEWAELEAKTRVLYQPPAQAFELLETMRWSGRRVFLLEDHLRRLAASADYFDFKVDIDHLRRLVQTHVARLPAVPHRCRLTVSRSGGAQFSASPFQPPAPGDTAAVPLAGRCISSKQLMLRHKTTQRDVYAQAEAAPGRETLLYNEYGRLTESTIANLVYQYQGGWYTPPLSDGLLPGVLRGALLRAGKVKERSLHRNELPAVQRLYLVNALRGWRRLESFELSGERQ